MKVFTQFYLFYLKVLTKLALSETKAEPKLEEELISKMSGINRLYNIFRCELL